MNTETLLQDSYSEWAKNSQLRAFIKDSFDEDEQAKVFAVVERLILSMLNHADRDDGVLFWPIPERDPVFEKFRGELAALGFTSKKLENFIPQFYRMLTSEDPATPVEEKKSDPSIIYRDYEDNYPGQRLKDLYLKGGDAKLLCALCLRYSSLSMGGQQWSIPQKVADDLWKLGISGEGFASPFNSKFFGKPNTRYCSVFRDLDPVFGSSGSFFDHDLDGGWMVNPPFIESIMLRVAQTIKERLARKDVLRTFVVIFPFWNDSEGYKMLNDSGYPSQRYHKTANTYSYVGETGVPRKVRTPSTVFCLSNDPSADFLGIQRAIEDWK